MSQALPAQPVPAQPVPAQPVPARPVPPQVDHPKPGYLTTEFWVTVVTLALPLLTLLFHKDFSGQVQAIAAAAAGVATALYTLSRALTKAAHIRAHATIAIAAPPVPVPPEPTGLPALPAVLDGTGRHTVVVVTAGDLASAAAELADLVGRTPADPAIVPGQRVAAAAADGVLAH